MACDATGLRLKSVFALVNGRGCVAPTALREIRATYHIPIVLIMQRKGHQIKLISPIQKKSDIANANRGPAHFSSLIFRYVKSGRGDSYTDCDCLGYEWELIDPARRTVCIGIVRSITCYQFIGGPVVDCESL